MEKTIVLLSDKKCGRTLSKEEIFEKVWEEQRRRRLLSIMQKADQIHLLADNLLQSAMEELEELLLSLREEPGLCVSIRDFGRSVRAKMSLICEGEIEARTTVYSDYEGLRKGNLY